MRVKFVKASDPASKTFESIEDINTIEELNILYEKNYKDLLISFYNDIMYITLYDTFIE